MPQLHIIGPNAFARGALSRAANAAGGIHLGIVDAQWLALHDWGFGTDVVILRARMYDVWPALVKVRALAALDCRAIVLIGHATPAEQYRLREAGAWAVLHSPGDLNPERVIAFAKEALLAIEQRNDGQLTQQAVLDPSSAEDRPGSFEPLFPLSSLSDRVLQIAGLYVSAASPHAQDVGRVFGLGESTVKAHLSRVRAVFRNAGVDTSSRAALRERMIAEGLLIGEMGW